jgi:hypothetical protein
MPATRLTIEQRASTDLTREHIFEAKGLCAKLNFVPGVFLWPPPFIFDGKGLPQSLRARERHSTFRSTKLDYVGFADESETQGVHPQSSGGSYARTALRSWLVGTLMKQAPFGGEAILVP